MSGGKHMRKENISMGKKLIVGVNDLATTHPNIAKEWDYEKNEKLKPSDVLTGSRKKVWWKCNKGHEWQAIISSRASNGNGCPYCANQKVWKGYNDVATTCSELLKEWDYDKNTIKPEEITKGSNKKVWWICSKGHSYLSSPARRTSQGSGCPICSNKKVLSGFNDLATTHPKIAAEWDYEKNDFLPSEVVYGSQKKAWFLCEKGHSYNATIQSRTIEGNACPFCSSHRVLSGFNDLASNFPEIAKEWNYEKNGDLRPNQIAPKSNKKFWFTCSRGHDFRLRIADRIYSGQNCPICAKEKQSSFPEQALFFYIRQAFSDAENGNKTTIGMELDIYIPSIKTAIEYDGWAWHRFESSIKNDKNKNQICKENGIQLIRVRERELPFFDDCVCFNRKDKKNESLNGTIADILNFLKIDEFDVDVERDNSSILSLYVFEEKQKSLAIQYPTIAKEWSIKNGDLVPTQIMAHSGKKVWFTCSKGHDYLAKVSDRVNGTACPYCAGRKILKGFNDLASQFPQIASEWDYNKNGDLKPDEVTWGSGKKIWWKCENGHSFQSCVATRTTQNVGCPECHSLKRSPVVVCLENGKIYKNPKEACLGLGFIDNDGIISTCVRGKRKTAFGLHWRLATEEEKAYIGLVETSNKKAAPKKIQFDSNRSDAYNRMAIDKMSQVMIPSEGMKASVLP